MADYSSYKIALGYTGDWSIPQHAHIDATEAVATTVEGLGSVYQAKDATLTALAGVTTAADKLIYATGSDTFSTTTFTAAGRALVDDADAAAQRTTLGLVIGTNVQAADTTLTALAGVTTAADKLIYATGSDIFSTTTFTAAGRALVDDADAAAQRTTLGLGTAATYNIDTSGSTVPLLSGANTWGAAQAISVADNTNPALKITQTGTGNALVVEDSTSPDATPFVIDASGNVIGGHSSKVGSLYGWQLHANSAVNGNPEIAAFNWDLSASYGPSFGLYKSQSDTTGTNGIVTSGASSSLRFWFDDGTQFLRAAEIAGVVDGTPGTNAMPGRLVFSTTADGASSPTERMRIDSTGLVTLAAGQIKFPATQNASADANTLDDYEEGTFTPVVSDAASAGNNATATANGYYTKVGRVVTVVISLIGINTTGLTAGNTTFITGLPFAILNNTGNDGSCVVFAQNCTSTAGCILGTVSHGATSIRLYNGTTTGSSNFLVSQITSTTGNIYFTTSYFV